MITWLIYDISDDKKRGKIAKKCKQIGLHRVQKSVFLGNLNNNELDTITIECESIIDEESDSVYIFPLCQTDFNKVKLIGKAFDKKYVSDEVLQEFF